MGASNLITIHVTPKNNYFGPLFIGSSFEDAQVVYDTVSGWTTVNVEKAINAQMKSEYDPENSDTAVSQWRDYWNPATA